MSAPDVSAAALSVLLTSKAFLDLDTQVAIGAMSPTDAASLKAQYAQLYAVKSALADGEREAVAHRTDLASSIIEATTLVDAANAEKSHVESKSVTAEAERDELIAEMASLEARDSLLQNELGDMRSREAAAMANLESAEADNARLTGPVLTALADEASAAAGEVAEASAAASVAVASTRALEIRADNIARSIARSKETIEATEEDISRLRSEPMKAKAALEGVERVLQQVSNEVDRATQSLAQNNEDAAKQLEAASTTRVVRAEVDAKLKKFRGDTMQGRERIEKLEAALRSERSLTAELLVRKTELFAAREQARSDLSAASSSATSAAQAYERAKRELKSRTDALNNIRAAVAPAEARLLSINTEKAAAEREKTAAGAAVSALRKEMDVLIAQFLREEAIEKKHRDAVREAAERCSEAEAERDARLFEDAAEEKVGVFSVAPAFLGLAYVSPSPSPSPLQRIATIKAQRDMKIRETAKLTALRVEAEEELSTKKLELVEVKGQLTALMAQKATTLELLESINREKVAFERSAAAASSGVAEISARSKHVAAELDVLTGDLANKERALDKERHALKAAQIASERSRDEVNANLALQAAAQESLEQHRREVEYASRAIRAMQKQMDLERRQLSATIEARNANGARLADVDNEFAVLSEKSNLIEAAREIAERKLHDLSDEVRALKTICSDLKRQQEAAKRLIPKNDDAIEVRRNRLREEFAAVSAEADKLTALMTDPKAVKMRKLEGEDLEESELEHLASALESRASAARERLLRQTARRDENRSHRIALEKQAEGEDGSTSATAATRQLNENAARVRETTRKLMSAVAELSLHEATAAKLEQETDEITSVLRAAEARLASGLPPTDTAVMMAKSLVRQATVPAPSATDVPQARGTYVQDGVIVGSGTVQGLPRPTPFPPARGLKS